MSYKSRRRPWVKLYCRDWLTGTVRFQLTPVDRSIFVDSLAMAGDSRFPGVVAAGFEGAQGSHLMGYPLAWLAAHFGTDEAQVRHSLALLEAQERVKVEEYKDTFIIHILGWTRYQSEYLRQLERFSGDAEDSAQTSAETPQKVEQTSGDSTQKLSLEVEVEGEVEGDIEKEKPNPLARVAAQFEEFWKRYPRHHDKKRAFSAWRNLSQADRDLAMKNLELWIHCRQWREERGRFVPYAQKWLNRELFKESPSLAPTSGRSFDERARAAEKKTR